MRLEIPKQKQTRWEPGLFYYKEMMLMQTLEERVLELELEVQSLKENKKTFKKDVAKCIADYLMACYHANELSKHGSVIVFDDW